jgi:eukaryotic-like serine/threonine-protein kinase
VVASTLLLLVSAVAIRLVVERKRALTEKDTIVLADFANSTGDPVFDGTLHQGIIVQLEQSLFLSLISEERIQHTLTLMGQPAGGALTGAVAREVCQRMASTAGRAFRNATNLSCLDLYKESTLTLLPRWPLLRQSR